MIYLSGTLVPVVHPRVGYMLTPLMGQSPPAARPWAADNGCFSRPERFSWPMYLGWLEAQGDARERCLFAAAPDVLGDAWATLERYGGARELIQSAGYRPALVAQDGLTSPMVPWQIVDVLFIGGTDDWKTSEPAYSLVAEARARGCHVHVGRVNSHRRLKAFHDAGAHSADGTFLKYAPDKNVPRLVRWFDKLEESPSLLAD